MTFYEACIDMKNNAVVGETQHSIRANQYCNRPSELRVSGGFWVWVKACV